MACCSRKLAGRDHSAFPIHASSLQHFLSCAFDQILQLCWFDQASTFPFLPFSLSPWAIINGGGSICHRGPVNHHGSWQNAHTCRSCCCPYVSSCSAYRTDIQRASPAGPLGTRSSIGAYSLPPPLHARTVIKQEAVCDPNCIEPFHSCEQVRLACWCCNKLFHSTCNAFPPTASSFLHRFQAPPANLAFEPKNPRSP